MKSLFNYITEALKSISTNMLSSWRQKVGSGEYYQQELTSNKYIRHLINALIGEGMTKINRRRFISDFVEMYFGNYMAAKDGSFTLAHVKEIEFADKNHDHTAIVVVTDRWFGGLLAKFTFKVHLTEPEKYLAEKKPKGTAGLTISIETPVYKSEKEISWKSTRKVIMDVPACIPQGDPLYVDFAKQLAAQTRDMEWGFYDPIKNRFSKED